MIHLKNCTIGYTNPLFSLDAIQLLKGEIYALIGSNGAGKSTFFATITQQTKLLNGSITIDQQPINKFSKNSLAKQIAFVESTSDLPDFLTVREYLALGRTPFTNTLGRLTLLDIEQINKIVGVLDLAPYLSKFMLNLSDGERQIMAIGRALVQDTPLIILDEPTAFLDYGNRKKIIQLLKLLAKKENKCILFSSHDIELCLDEVQQILYIDFEEKKLISTGNITKERLIQKAFPL